MKKEIPYSKPLDDDVIITIIRCYLLHSNAVISLFILGFNFYRMDYNHPHAGCTRKQLQFCELIT